MFRQHSYLPIGFGLAAIFLLDWGHAHPEAITRATWSVAEMAAGILVGTIVVGVGRVLRARASKR